MNDRERSYIEMMVADGISREHAAQYISYNRTSAKKYNLKYTRFWLRRNFPVYGNDSLTEDYEGMETEPTTDELHTNEGNTGMNINHSITALQDFNTVGVRFTDSNKEYTYKTNDTFELGDSAVVCPNGILKIVRISRVDETPQIDFGSNVEYKWIVQKIDTTNYANITDQEERMAVELRKSIANKKRNEVKAALIEQIGAEGEAELLSIIGNIKDCVKPQ